jgi:hypothetical protein
MQSRIAGAFKILREHHSSEVRGKELRLKVMIKAFNKAHSLQT